MTETTSSTQAAAGGIVRILVHAEPAGRSAALVRAAADLAQRLGAQLTGLGAEMIEPLAPANPYAGVTTAEWVAAMSEQIEANLKSAEAECRRSTEGASADWRTCHDMIARALAMVARSADLIIVGAAPSVNYYRAADPAEVVMQAGRPVLLAPEGAERFTGRAAVIAWKDTREARRAVLDALPLLRRTEEALVQAVCAEPDAEYAEAQTSDVAAWLDRHGVNARARVSAGTEADVVDELTAEALASGADLIVAGAYGHSRLREWAFGGVTRTLLDDPRCWLFLSH